MGDAVIEERLKQFASLVRSSKSALSHAKQIGVFEGSAQISDLAWCAFYLDLKLHEEKTLDETLKLVPSQYPNHVSKIPSRLELKSALKIDAVRLNNILKAVGPDIDKSTLLSFYWDARGVGIPMLCCDAVASSAVFDPAALKIALSAFREDILLNGVAAYIPAKGMLVIRDSQFAPSAVVLVMELA